MLFLSVFPYAFFFGGVMTEGLFLLATTGACWYAWRGKWLAFGLFGALAALTRMTGLLVIAVLLFVGITACLLTRKGLARLFLSSSEKESDPNV